VARPGTDPLRRRSLRFRQHGVGVELEVLEGTFSAAGVDVGTRHLLRWLAADRYAGVASVLDVGCGYGPLALWLAAAGPDRSVLAVDRDARAVEATTLGAARNGLAQRVRAQGGLGYDGLGEARFDLVVSNVPAKVGPAALAHLLLDAVHHLTPAGSVAVVVVDRLAGAVQSLLDDPSIEVLDARPAAGYTAFEYRFTGEPAGSSREPGFDRGVYRRDRRAFAAAGRRWDAEVSWSIPEFDGLSHGTEAVLEVAADLGEQHEGPLVVGGVGQGHLPLALAGDGAAGAVRLVDRDLLALRTAAANLRARGGADVEVRHEGRWTPSAFAGASAVVVELPVREPVAATAAVLGPAVAAAGDAPVVLHGRAADVSRVLELVRRHGARLEEAGRHRVGGHVAVRTRVRASSATPPA
jgi:16S rRNA G1207 methylase RsmC